MICLDFDGVIADSHPMWLEVYRATARAFGVDASGEARPFATLRPLTFETLGARLGLDPRAFAEAMTARALAREATEPLFPGMEETLRALATQAPLAIVSSSRVPVIERFLAVHGLSDAFARVVGSGQGLTKAQVLGTLAAEGAVVMVGDAVSDIEAARAAGLKSVGVTWGWQDAAVLADADTLVSTPAELLGAVRAMTGPAARA